MKSIKRKVGLIMAGLMVAGTVAATPAMAKTVFEKNNSGWAYKYDDEVGVKVNWLIGTDKTSAHMTEAGTQAGYYVTAEGAEKVEYNLWYYDTEGNWVSTGWSEAVDAKVPHLIKLPEGEVLEDGINKVSVWVREEGKEKAHFSNENGSYDAYNYTGVKAGKTEFDFGGEADYTVAGSKLTFNGFEGLENVEYKVNIYNNETGKWANGEFGVNEATIAEGMNLVNVHIDTNKDGKWDAYRLFMVDNTKSAESVKVTTSVEEGLFTSKVTVTADSKDVVSYKLFQVVEGEELELTVGGAVKNGEVANNVLAKKGETVIVRLYGTEETLLGEGEVVLGEEGTIAIAGTEKPEVETMEATATVVKEGLFTNEIKVECDAKGVDAYRMFQVVDGEELELTVGGSVKIGEVAKNVLAKAGETVTVRLYDANGNLVGEDTEVVIAK